MSKTMKGLIAGLIVLALATAGVIIYARLSEPDYSKVPYPTVTITMENGDEIHLELYPDVAPNTVANFVQLAQDGFYDGTIFHRVIAGFMIQGGDPTGTGMGGPGFTIKGEFSANGFANNLSHTRGVISMARAGLQLGGQPVLHHARRRALAGRPVRRVRPRDRRGEPCRRGRDRHHVDRLERQAALRMEDEERHRRYPRLRLQGRAH